LSFRALRSSPPSPPYSVPHIHTHIARTRQPLSTRTLSSPHQPAHPPQRASGGRLTPHCKVRRAVRTSIQGRSESPSRWGSGPSTGCCPGPCIRHPHHRRTQPHIHTHIARTRQPLSTRTLLPSPPCSPTQRASLEWAADPTLQGAAVVRAAQFYEVGQRAHLRGDLSPQNVLFQDPALATPTTTVLSATHPHAQRSHPPASLYTNTLLPSPPCSPTQRASLS
jgi:hypothetical protein